MKRTRFCGSVGVCLKPLKFNCLRFEPRLAYPEFTEKGNPGESEGDILSVPSVFLMILKGIDNVFKELYGHMS